MFWKDPDHILFWMHKISNIQKCLLVEVCAVRVLSNFKKCARHDDCSRESEIDIRKVLSEFKFYFPFNSYGPIGTGPQSPTQR